MSVDAQYDELIHSHMYTAPLKCLSDWHETVTKCMLKACNLQNATAMSMDVVALMVIGDSCVCLCCRLMSCMILRGLGACRSNPST